MKATVRRASFPDGRRILMLSDPHGHADGLRALLKKAGLSRKDILVIVGDLLEKGPQSLDTLRLVMALEKEYTVYPLMGNVDLWRWEFLTSDDPGDALKMRDYSLRAREWWGGSFLHDLCGELGVSLCETTDIVSLFPVIRRHFAKELQWLSRLPTILDTPGMTFVHGGLPHERLDELAGTDAFPLLKFDDFYRAGLSFRKFVTVGHWPTVLCSPAYPDFRPIIDRKRRIICLDGACGVKPEGQLNLLIQEDWRSEAFDLMTWDHLPAAVALDGQASSPPEKAVYVNWNQRWITVLRRGEEMSRVDYQGKILDVPNHFLGREDDGRDYCRDATDYVLPVSPGDELKVILPIKRGLYAKKDSAAGWYFGRYEMKTEV